jgi:rhodanese-related sulfurtransferase
MNLGKFFFDNILLIAVAFASGLMLLWPLVRRNAGGPWASAAEATLLINRQDAIVLDVRDANAFANGHILNAKNIPMGQLEGRAGELEKWKAKPVIVHCDNGQRAGPAVALLKQRGFTNVFNLQGGFAAWKQAGLPVTK